MPKFYGYISNDKYAIGCTGQTIYVYDNTGKELAKFKDIKYCYSAMFCPTQNIFVAKSNEAYLTVYSLDTLSLIRKVDFSSKIASQDDGYCFSADGKYFYNIERHGTSCHSAISIYDTATFERVKMFLEDDEYTEPSCIEYDENGQLFVLGFLRGENRVMKTGFIAKLNENGLDSVREIPKDTYEYYRNYKILEMKGFTDKAKECSGFYYEGVDMTGMENTKLPLSELWEKS